MNALLTEKLQFVGYATHFGKVDNIDSFKLPGSITHKQNVVKTQTMPLSYHSKVDNKLQPNFHSNEPFSELD